MGGTSGLNTGSSVKSLTLPQNVLDMLDLHDMLDLFLFFPLITILDVALFCGKFISSHFGTQIS